MGWKPPKISSLPSWEGVKKIGIDVETKDPDITKLGSGCRRSGCYMVGYSFALEHGPSFYVPIKHEAGGNVDFEQARSYIQDQAKHFTGEIVGMNLAYDLDWLQHDLGVRFNNVQFFRDIGNADPLIYELEDFYNMNAIAERHGVRPKDEDLLFKRAEELGLNPKRDLWKMHSEDVGTYASVDAELPLQILAKQQKLIDAHGLQPIFDLESEVLPLLLKMRERGVRINETQLEFIERYSLDEEAKELRQVKHLTGIEIKLGDVWKASKLAPVFESIGIKLPRTSTGKPSIKKSDMLDYKHPVSDAISRARIVNKLRTTFVESIRKHMINGRIHCTFNQIARETESGDQKGGRYGRLSCMNPNLQQQPSRGEFANLWRGIYIPEDGALWACNDYSQQEPRWTTHFANIMKLPGAAEAAREYRENPKADNHDMMSKMTGLPRKDSKGIYLGLCYGEGGAKMCKTMGLPTRWCLHLGDYRNRQTYYFMTEKEARDVARMHRNDKKFMYECAGEEGQKIIDQFNEKAPFIKLLSKMVQGKANKYGFIKTIGGRHLHFEEKVDASGYNFTYKALNRLIQGSSADQMKRAMLDVDAEVPDFYLQLQVHDEIDGSVENPEIAKKAAKVMKESTLSTVPFRVDVEIGPSWGSLQDVSVFQMHAGWNNLLKELSL